MAGPHPGQPGYVAPVAARPSNILGTIQQGHPNWFPGQSQAPAQGAPNILGTIQAGHPNWFPPVAGAPVGSVYHGTPAGNPAQTAPTPTAPANSATTQQPSPSPLDATYYANVAANQFKVNNEINALNLQGSQAGTALQSALGQLAYQQPRAQLALEQRANQGGGLYSSVYDQNLGNLDNQYLTNQNAAQQRHDSALGSINSRIAADQQGIPIYNADQALLSAERQARLAAANPGTGQGTGGLNTNPPTGGGAGGGSGSHSGGSGSGSGSTSGGRRGFLGTVRAGHPNWFPTVPGSPPGSVYHGARPPASRTTRTLSVRAGQAVSNLRARGL